MSTHCQCGICSAGLERPWISALCVCSFEQWSLLADGDVHKCSPAHLIGLKCPFKLNSPGAEIMTSPGSVEQRQGCQMRILVIYKEKSQHVLVNAGGKKSKRLQQGFLLFKEWKEHSEGMLERAGSQTDK